MTVGGRPTDSALQWETGTGDWTEAGDWVAKETERTHVTALCVCVTTWLPVCVISGECRTVK